MARAPEREASHVVEIPPYVKAYSPEAGLSSVRSGEAAAGAETLLVEQLRARGDDAEPDRALTATAAWALQGAYDQRDASDTQVITDFGARRPKSSVAATQIDLAELGDDSEPRLGVVLAAEAGPKQRLRCA